MNSKVTEKEERYALQIKFLLFVLLVFYNCATFVIKPFIYFLFGFTIHINLQEEKKTLFSFDKQEKIIFNNYTFGYKKFEKFSNDKLFTQDDDLIIGIDGVVLNLQQLKNEYATTNYFKLIKQLFLKQKIQFVRLLKGEFSGFVFDKKKAVLHFFNNKTATKRIFYTKNDRFLMISPSIENIITAKKSSHLKSSLNINATYHLLTFGGMIENNTLINDIYKLNAGEFLSYTQSQFLVDKYHSYNNIEYTINTKKEAVDALNETFIEALELEYKKDIEYNYNHIATLSGGLDSRMNVMIAHKLGYKNDTFCFSQPNYLDEKIARKIATDLELDFNFIPLDDGNYMKSLEEMIAINSGLQFYLGSAHYNFALKKIDLSNYGLMHTGQIGDGVLGGFVTSEKLKYSKLISTKLKDKIVIDKSIPNKYSNEEVFKLYQRVFNLTNYGSYVVENHQTYIVSPFMDDDFIKVALSINPKLKNKQQIYIDWINKHQPQIAKYPWEKTGFKPNKNWKSELSRYTKKIKKEYYSITNQQHKLSMNPLDYWFKNSKNIQSFYTDFFMNNIDLVDTNKELYTDLNLLFTTGNTVEKSMVLSVLEVIKKYELTV